jgi:hypothetical protein
MTPSDAGMSRIANIDEEHKRHFCGDPWHRVGQGPPQPYPPATVLGPQFANSGWSLTTTVAGGPHTMVAYAYSVVSQTWHAVTSTFSVNRPPSISLPPSSNPIVFHVGQTGRSPRLAAIRMPATRSRSCSTSRTVCRRGRARQPRTAC